MRFLTICSMFVYITRPLSEVLELTLSELSELVSESLELNMEDKETERVTVEEARRVVTLGLACAHRHKPGE